MRIDVVIPTRNRLWALKRVVAYYLNQKDVRAVIVVDDGSSDGSREWLAQQSAMEPRIQSLHHDESRGASAARNAGSEHTSAPFIFFADDDMFLRPADGLSVLVEELERNRGDIIGPALTFYEGEEPKAMVSNFSDPPGLFHYYNKLTLELRSGGARLKRVTPGSFPAALVSGVMMVRREVVRTVKYDEGLGASSYRDETDFQLKAFAAGFRTYCCDRVFLVDMARERDTGGCHGQSLLAYELLACRNNWRVLRRHRKILARLGAPYSVAAMQAAFVIEHLLSRFPRGLCAEWRSRFRNGLGS